MFCVNSLAHYLGEMPFDNRHTQCDHFITVLVTISEGLHQVLSQSGKPYLVTARDDRTVKVWDYLSNSCIQTMEGHTSIFSFVVFHCSLLVVVSGGGSGAVGCGVGVPAQECAQLWLGVRMMCGFMWRLE